MLWESRPMEVHDEAGEIILFAPWNSLDCHWHLPKIRELSGPHPSIDKWRTAGAMVTRRSCHRTDVRARL